VLPIVVAELALVLVLVVLDRSWPAIAAVACCAGLLGAFFAVRVRGHLLCQWVLVAARFLVRDRAADLPGDQPGAALLRLIRPGAHTTPGAGQAFLISDEAGVGTVLRPERDPGPQVLSPRELLPDSDEQALAYAVQVVHHAGVDRSRPPRVWLTLQALRTAEVYADEDVRAALANVVRRVRRRLRRSGVPFRPLTEEETFGSYAALAHVNAGRGRVREEWWLWHSGPIRHATFRLDGWSGLDRQAAARLVRWLLASAPDTAVTVSRTAHHDPAGSLVVGAVLRIATSRPEALDVAVTDVGRLCDEVGVTLHRLDGRHVHGVAATLPLGIVTA
jgi:type VII secretion protein EccE